VVESYTRMSRSAAKDSFAPAGARASDAHATTAFSRGYDLPPLCGSDRM